MTINKLIRKTIEKNEHKFPKQLRQPIADFLRYSLIGYSYTHNLMTELHALMTFLSSPIPSPKLEKNFRTDSFFADNFPSIQKNKLFPFFCANMYGVKQKNYGAGEALLAMFFDDIEQAGKIGDFILEGKHLEIKSVVHAASLKAHEDSSFRPSNKVFRRIYGEKQRGLGQFWNGELSLFREYCNAVYPHLSDALISEVHSLRDDIKCRQHLGTIILKKYKQIDVFDNLIVVKPSEDNDDISFLNIADFSAEEFIKKHLTFTPVLHRGKGTQALGDGYVDIKLKK